MKKNIAKLLFLASILSVGNILNAHNQNVSKDVQKPIEIKVDDNGNVTKNQSNGNENNKPFQEEELTQLKIQQAQ